MSDSASARAVLRDESRLEKLPAAYQALLDPAQPLPAGVTHVPTQPSWLGVIGGIAGAVVAFLCGILSTIAYFADAASQPVTVYSGGTACLLTFGVIGVGVGVVCLLIARSQYRRLQARGASAGPRYGLFLARDGLLLRGDVGYTFLPREAITEARLEGSHAQVRYLRPDGQPFQLTLDQRYGGITGPQLLGLVQQWRAS